MKGSFIKRFHYMEVPLHVERLHYILWRCPIFREVCSF